MFGAIGWRDAKTDLTLTTAYANNSLTGNGLQEQRFLDHDYASVYTKPDITDNRSTFLNLVARRSARSNLSVSGNVYFRSIRTTGLNGDINENSLDQSVYRLTAADRAALTAAATPLPPKRRRRLNPPSGRIAGLRQDEPARYTMGSSTAEAGGCA